MRSRKGSGRCYVLAFRLASWQPIAMSKKRTKAASLQRNIERLERLEETKVEVEASGERPEAAGEATTTKTKAQAA